MYKIVEKIVAVVNKSCCVYRRQLHFRPFKGANNNYKVNFDSFKFCHLYIHVQISWQSGEIKL